MDLSKMHDVVKNNTHDRLKGLDLILIAPTGNDAKALDKYMQARNFISYFDNLIINSVELHIS